MSRPSVPLSTARSCKSYTRFLTSARTFSNSRACNSVTQLCIEHAREVAGEENVHVRAGSFPVRQGNHSEPNRFRADGFRAYPGLVIAALLGAIARAALDHERFFRAAKASSPVLVASRIVMENLLFGMWIEALRFAGRTPKSPELSAELFRNFTKSTILGACPTTLPSRDRWTA